MVMSERSESMVAHDKTIIKDESRKIGSNSKPSVAQKYLLKQFVEAHRMEARIRQQSFTTGMKSSRDFKFSPLN